MSRSSALVAYNSLSNPSKSMRDLQNVDLTRPSEETRIVNLEKTRQELNVATGKKLEPAHVSLLKNSFKFHF